MLIKSVVARPIAPMSVHITIPEHVVHENIDGEVIILNLKDGLYHTLNDAAGFIWARMVDGVDPASLSQPFSVEFDISDKGIADSLVTVLVKAALKENLIEVDGDWSSSDTSQLLDSGHPQLPVIHTYRDMQAALVLDPVHDVDHRTGWPNPKTTDDQPSSK
jgi:hypothetical protein